MKPKPKTVSEIKCRKRRELFIEVRIVRGSRGDRIHKLRMSVPADLVSDREISEGRLRVECYGISKASALPPDTSWETVT